MHMHMHMHMHIRTRIHVHVHVHVALPAPYGRDAERGRAPCRNALVADASPLLELPPTLPVDSAANLQERQAGLVAAPGGAEQGGWGGAGSGAGAGAGAGGGQSMAAQCRAAVWSACPDAIVS